jgi:hypothetical protein
MIVKPNRFPVIPSLPTAHFLCYTPDQNRLKMQPCAPQFRTIRRRARVFDDRYEI